MHGQDGDFFWASNMDEPWQLLHEHPEIVVGHRAVIAAFDFGSLTASDSEIQRGWRQDGQVVITDVIRSYEELRGAVSNDGGELWLFGSDQRVPSFAGWDHLAGEMCAITLAASSVASGDASFDADEASTRAIRAHHAALQQRLRSGLATYRPLTFLRQGLVVTRLGESDLPCRWAGCSRRALLSHDICVDHAYGPWPSPHGVRGA